ncbi:hypothetical protein DER45DRAFT_540992 [Fusarium avenaceum]|nr:hypothetical protein DER45DRAFT_540992 [Fusarium avenaceum]
MAPSISHPFTRLPVELRLQIWEAACVGSPATRPGLQYVDLRNDRAVAMPCGWPKASEQISATKINRSAYLIDGGLWRACKESREVIAKRTHLEDWVRIQKRTIVDADRYLKYNSDRPGGNEYHPAFIDTCEGEEECRMLVYPANDIFCIQVDNWIDLKEQGYCPEIYMSLILYKSNDREDDNDDDYDWPALYLMNIALEFNSTWLVDLPDHEHYLTDENSVRGYLAYLIKEKAFHGCDLNIEGEGIWIVDKEAKWFNKEHHDNTDRHHDTVYRDCDGEYVEVFRDQFVHYYRSDGGEPNAAVFLQRLDLMHIVDGYFSPWGGEWIESSGPKSEKIVRLLVRQDNEVKETTWRCKSKCDRLGWCICSDDEGD